MRFYHRIAISIILFIWCSLIFVEWFIPLNQNIIAAVPILQKTFSLVCHQQENKIIVSGVFHSLVCARCSGIYTGFFLCSVPFIFVSLNRIPRIKYLFFSVLPMLMDIGFYSLGIYPYSRIFAFGTGLLLGSFGFLYFYPAINQLIHELKSDTK